MDRFTKILIAMLVLVVLCFFWPGPYQYTHTGSGNVLVRINRLTGVAEHYNLQSGWVFKSPEAAPTPADAFGRPAPSVDLFGNPIQSPTPK